VRVLPFGAAISYLRGAIINYKERQTSEEYFQLKKLWWISKRSVAKSRREKVINIMFPQLKRSLENEIEEARRLIFDRRRL
jgi:triphosphoribosyl-dephospho-CoA synthetase